MNPKPASFDVYAPDYDRHFSHSYIGKAQRNQVWEELKNIITIGNEILELNCGTGEDAIYLHSLGATVTATDASSKMIKTARQKTDKIRFQTVAFEDVYDTFKTQKFDAIFSDFGGLNCASEIELSDYINRWTTLLKVGGKMIFVVMGTNCLWEKLYFLYKGNQKEAYRRKDKQGVDCIINGVSIRTFYYAPEFFLNAIKVQSLPLQTLILKPIGLFVPPSYLSPFMEKHSWLFTVLKNIDVIFRFRVFANQADHYILVLEKTEA